MTTLENPPATPTPHKTIGGDSGIGSGKGKWMALAAALLGWMFDGAEMGIFSMVGRPAVKDLLSEHIATLPVNEQEAYVGLWFGIITAGFLVGAATGGVLFGWLGDRIGRVRAMTLSVLTYALFTGACGLVGEAWQVGILRFIASLGMGGEWSLGVALVMEVWPNRSRAFMAGLIGAAANVGYLLVGFAGLVLSDLLATIHDGLIAIGVSPAWAHELAGPEFSGWRMMMLMGTLPALLTFFIRIFVPESERWEKEKAKGSTGHWATLDLLGVLAGLSGPALIIFVWGMPVTERTATWTIVQIVCTLLGLAIATVGYTFPVIRYFQRHREATGGEDWGPTFRRMLLAACLSGVALLGTWGSTQWAPSWADKLIEPGYKAEVQKLTDAGDAAAASKLKRPRAKEYTQIWLAVGAIVGTILAALMGDWMGRRAAYCLLCVLSLASVYLLFLGNTTYGPAMLFWTFIAGTMTASFYGWLPLYLPELFHTNVRATGQGFGFNFGRILAAIGVLQTGNLMGLFKDGMAIGEFTIAGGYPLACSTMSLVYLVGMVLIWFAPETHGKPLPE